MNELETVSPEDYRDEVKKIMEAKRAVHPDTEFILITSMTRHPTWLGESAAASKLFADKLKELAGPGCAVADLHALWTKVLERKDFYDITGNGVNHPNDYGHRLYTAVLENIFA
jgi:KaiC/GvpD/RAD55 family RecA-like ATPase